MAVNLSGSQTLPLQTPTEGPSTAVNLHRVGHRRTNATADSRSEIMAFMAFEFAMGCNIYFCSFILLVASYVLNLFEIISDSCWAHTGGRASSEHNH